LIGNNVDKIISEIEVAVPKNELETSYDAKFVPLGSIRLKVVELLHLLVKLGKVQTLSSLA
jgi:hypothetical protein